MATSSEVHEPAIAPAPAPGPAPPPKSTLRKFGTTIKLVISRSIFWAYERGSWQYDLIVIAILAFIFFSPRIWFNDRPTMQLPDIRHLQGIIEVDRTDRQVRFLVDPRLVGATGQKPEDAIPNILKEHIHRPFTVKSIDAIRDRHQVILSYTVVVEE
jgi:hypothetical protein